ncbi:hypothetical protein [Methylobacterium durans]|nr:hypothetical protein [Methylobacterium durans]
MQQYVRAFAIIITGLVIVTTASAVGQAHYPSAQISGSGAK